jgi:hypothetical protein
LESVNQRAGTARQTAIHPDDLTSFLDSWSVIQQSSVAKEVTDVNDAGPEGNLLRSLCGNIHQSRPK